MNLIAIIGGSGFNDYDDLVVNDAITQKTPYGAHSGPVLQGCLGSRPCLFLPRHGTEHRIPPHKVNYRANLWLLKELGVSQVIACNIVGGINSSMSPNTIVIPDQLIDYTYGRENTFYDGSQHLLLGERYQKLAHIDFSLPYSEALRQKVIGFFEHAGINCVTKGVYACTQGPRLETAAEIERLKRDGCDIVGMTAMPETALAKEIGMEYISIAIVVNWGAGIHSMSLSMAEIMETVHNNMRQIKIFMPKLLQFL